MSSQEGGPMRRLGVLTLSIAVLVASAPGVGQATGRPGIGRGHSVGEPSSSISTFTTSPGGHRRFDRNLLDGTAVVPWTPYDTPYALLPESPDEVPVPIIVQAAPPPEPPAPDPKFVFPPAPRGPEALGTQSAVIQRGSKIEVQSFPAARDSTEARASARRKPRPRGQSRA